MPRPPASLRIALAGAVVLAVGPLTTSPVAAEVPGAPARLTGEVVRAYLDPSTPEEAGEPEHAEPLTWVEPETGEPVRLTGRAAEELPLGATVEVRVGAEVVDEAAAEGGLDPARPVLAAEVVEEAPEEPVAAAEPPYTNTVTIAMVAPQGMTRNSRTAEDIAAIVEGPVADFWEKESYGEITIGVAPITAANQWVDTTTPCSDYASLWTETATRLGFDPDAPGQHLLLYLPETPEQEGCGYGLGTIGLGPASGGVAYVRDDIPSVIAHELGHNFGLEHASLKQCIHSLEQGACGTFAYADLYDVMGVSWSHIGSLSALNGGLIDVLPAENRYDVGSTDPTLDYTLSPIGSRTGRVGLRLAFAQDVYWLEYRTAVGQDAWLSGDPDLRQGVLLRHGQWDPFDNIDDSSLLLDGTPPTPATIETDLQTVLPLRQTLWLAGGAFQVTVRSTGSTAVVRVATTKGAPLPRDSNGDVLADVMAVAPTGTLYNYRSNGGEITGRVALGGGWQNRDVVVSTGDWNGDDVDDVLARDPRTGKLWFYAGNGTGGLRAGTVLGGGWNAMNALLSPGDWNGDGTADLLARRRSDGVLYLYAGNGAGGHRAPVRLGAGWGSMTALAATGDLDWNGTIDFVARRPDGMLMLYSGNGRGGWAGGPRRLSGGWQQFTAITGPGDWTGDMAPDLLVKKVDGSLLLYPGRGTGAFQQPVRLGGGWGRYRLGV